ncbi:MAG: hypothetical protein JJT90_11085 [Ectothiorhodospiraceae bacterium]|nr:hypothetical protein [Ectothiorhodospiraceae bacterium]
MFVFHVNILHPLPVAVTLATQGTSTPIVKPAIPWRGRPVCREPLPTREGFSPAAA